MSCPRAVSLAEREQSLTQICRYATETREELLYNKEKLLANGDKWEPGMHPCTNADPCLCHLLTCCAKNWQPLLALTPLIAKSDWSSRGGARQDGKLRDMVVEVHEPMNLPQRLGRIYGQSMRKRRRRRRRHGDADINIPLVPTCTFTPTQNALLLSFNHTSDS